MPYLPQNNPESQSNDSLQVEIVVHEGTIKIPFVAHLTSGNSKWSVPKFLKLSQSVVHLRLHTREVAGEYTGTDATMIKMELSEVGVKRTKAEKKYLTQFSSDQPSRGQPQSVSHVEVSLVLNYIDNIHLLHLYIF